MYYVLAGTNKQLMVEDAIGVEMLSTPFLSISAMSSSMGAGAVNNSKKIITMASVNYMFTPTAVDRTTVIRRGSVVGKLATVCVRGLVVVIRLAPALTYLTCHFDMSHLPPS